MCVREAATEPAAYTAIATYLQEASPHAGGGGIFVSTQCAVRLSRETGAPMRAARPNQASARSCRVEK